MHRIDSPHAAPGGVFTEGDPMVPTPATEVSADWLNAVQEEVAAVVAAAGIELKKADNAQLLQAIAVLIANAQPGLATLVTPGLCRPDGTTLSIADGVMSVIGGELDTWRKNNILIPRGWRSTTLPANHAWANGDAILLGDWPEAKAIVDAGGLAGMLLPSDANAAVVAANLGAFRLSADGRNLYLPNLSGQFLRSWIPGAARAAGSSQGDAMRNLTGSIAEVCDYRSGVYGSFYLERTGSTTAFPYSDNPTWAKTGVSFNASYQVPTDTEFRPINVAQPVVIYLGRHV